MISGPKRYFLTIKKCVSMRIKMETSDTLVYSVGIFETRVKLCRRKNNLVPNIPGTNTYYYTM